MPFLPYMQSLDIDKDDLVQALGILFIFLIGALTFALVRQGAFDATNVMGGIAAIVPTSIGVGTDALFEQLGVRTAPRFESQSRIEGTCRAEPSCPYGPEYDSAYPGAMAGGAFADAGAAEVLVGGGLDVLPQRRAIRQQIHHAPQALQRLQDNPAQCPPSVPSLGPRGHRGRLGAS